MKQIIYEIHYIWSLPREYLQNKIMDNNMIIHNSSQNNDELIWLIRNHCNDNEWHMMLPQISMQITFPNT